MTKKYQLMALGLLALLGVNCQALECREIEKSSSNYEKYVVIPTTGKHCLTHDIKQETVFDIHSMSYKNLTGMTLLEINYRSNFIDTATRKRVPNPPLTESSFFEIDMQGHAIKSIPENLVGFEKFIADARIKISNGTIEVPGFRSPNIGIELGNYGGNLNIAGSRKSVGYQQNEDIPASETLDKKPPAYKPSNFVVDNMKIHAGWRGVSMGGGGNVLRNSTIDVDGHTAVFMYGPGSVIENNTIIIHGKLDAKPFDAAIKLRDAHGAVVRNNRIIFKGQFFGKAPAALNLLDSKEVLIEGNTVEGFETLVRSNGDTKFIDKNNGFK
jgi:hypothetical protein